jgi:hypothetical protein
MLVMDLVTGLAAQMPFAPVLEAALARPESIATPSR